MFGNVIPVQMLIDEIGGIQYHLPLYIPEYYIDPQCICSVKDDLVCLKSATGTSHSSSGTAYHPTFQRLRKHLEGKGYIQTEQWHNGDIVLEEFILNGYKFSVRENFLSPSAVWWRQNATINSFSI